MCLRVLAMGWSEKGNETCEERAAIDMRSVNHSIKHEIGSGADRGHGETAGIVRVFPALEDFHD